MGKYQILKILTLVALINYSTNAQNRQLSGTAGTSSSIGYYSVGESVVSMVSSTKVTLYQGFIMPSTLTILSNLPMAVQPDPNMEVTVIGSNESDISIYPNPVEQGGLVVIRSKLLSSASTSLSIFNSSGQQLSISTANVNLDVELPELQVDVLWPPGFYILKIPVTSGFLTKKVIVR